jgi:hypothetical protein
MAYPPTSFLTPVGGKLNITLSGAPKQLARLDARALVDVSNLLPGIYEVPIRFVLPCTCKQWDREKQKQKSRFIHS